MSSPARRTPEGLTRREVLARAAALGLSATAAGRFLAACGDRSSTGVPVEGL